MAFPIQKWPYLSQFCVYFSIYNEKVFIFSQIYFPKSDWHKWKSCRTCHSFAWFAWQVLCLATTLFITNYHKSAAEVHWDPVCLCSFQYDVDPTESTLVQQTSETSSHTGRRGQDSQSIQTPKRLDTRKYNMTTKPIADTRNSYVRDMVSDTGSNNKKLYSYCKSMKSDSSGAPMTVCCTGLLIPTKTPRHSKRTMVGTRLANEVNPDKCEVIHIMHQSFVTTAPASPTYWK